MRQNEKGLKKMEEDEKEGKGGECERRFDILKEDEKGYKRKREDQ